MRHETTESSIKLVEHFAERGEWAVRWDFKYKGDGIYWYEEDVFNYIPSIEDIQQLITEWYNKQTTELILYGFVWNDKRVYLSDENKFNYKAIIDEAARIESAIKAWDEKHPDLAGKNYIFNGEFEEPTGRPSSLLPVTLKLGTNNTPENFYVFNTLTELQEFFSAGVQYLIDAYGRGWYQIATFDYEPYIKELENLNK